MNKFHRRYIVIPTAGFGTSFQTNTVTQEDMMHADFVIDVDARTMEKCRTHPNGPIPVRAGAARGSIAAPLHDPDLDDPYANAERYTEKPKRKIITMLRKLAPWNF